MTKHLFGAIVTSHGVAANNRGENEGNLTTLQKILWNGDVYTTVSAEAIRWAIRAVWQDEGLKLNRDWNEEERRHNWKDVEFAQSGRPFVDDDVLGFMSAQAAREESGGETTQGRRRARGKTSARRSRFEVTRAISLSPWAGDVVFNVASPGAAAAASRTGSDPVPYSGEVHATRYQYGFAFTPEHLYDPSRAAAVVDAVITLSEVAGNHARYLFDFAPDAIVFRWTDDPAPRILYSFTLAGHSVTVPEVLRRVRSGDIDASELVVGGSLSETDDGRALEELGARIYPGVKAAAKDIKARLPSLLKA
jgi:CRISPR-associated protein Cst2